MTDHALLEYAESAGLENLRNHLAAADSLAKEANTTLTVLLAGAGGSLAYAVRLFEESGITNITIGLGAACLYLFAISAILVFRCMKVKDLPSPTNEPLNLYRQEFTLDKIRRKELENIQERIHKAEERNNITAFWLNRVRLLAASTPLVLGLVMFLAYVARLVIGR